MARIERLEIRNYKVLADVKIGRAYRKEGGPEVLIQPFSVFLGPNGGGKSTLFDVFGFLAQCLQTNVSDALAQRGGFHEVRSRGKTGPIAFEIKYRDQPNDPLMTYELHINERDGQPIVEREYLRYRRGQTGQPFYFLKFENGQGEAAVGLDEAEADRQRQQVDRPDILAIKGLGQLATYSRIANLRRFIEGWYLSYFVPDLARTLPDIGYAEHLSQRGDNLSNYTRFLSERHPAVFNQILAKLAQRIPGLESVSAEPTADGRIMLRFKDRPFDEPFVARFVSDGTVKMFAYLALLNDPNPPPLLCIEEPENGLHPQLLGVLVEEFRLHSEQTQVFLSSHSPRLVDYLEPQELWVIDRGEDGYARVHLAAETPGVEAFVENGLNLGELWLSKHLGGGNL
jgi:predicted ATPase